MTQPREDVSCEEEAVRTDSSNEPQQVGSQTAGIIRCEAEDVNSLAI